MVIEDAIKILEEFIVKMNEWEIHYYKEVSNKGLIAVKEKMKNDLDIIFTKYCTLKDRKQGRQTSLFCSDPPTYPPSEKILYHELTKNKAIISTQQQTGFKNQYRYTLVFKNDEWRIDKKERFSSYEKKWIKDSL